MIFDSMIDYIFKNYENLGSYKGYSYWGKFCDSGRLSNLYLISDEPHADIFGVVTLDRNRIDDIPKPFILSRFAQLDNMATNIYKPDLFDVFVGLLNFGIEIHSGTILDSDFWNEFLYHIHDKFVIPFVSDDRNLYRVMFKGQLALIGDNLIFIGYQKYKLNMLERIEDNK